MDNNSRLVLSDKTFGNKKKCTRKPTEFTKSWVRNQVRKYSKQIGISDRDIPNVVFSRKEVFAMPKTWNDGYNLGVALQ